MFSYGSSSSTSLLTVTPSLVTTGLPKLLSMMTLRPVGPIVTATASASVLTPRCSLSRARSSNRSCFATLSAPELEFSEFAVQCIMRTRLRSSADIAIRVLHRANSRSSEQSEHLPTTFARMSLSRRILTSSPSTSMSVPPYLPNRTSSPTLTRDRRSARRCRAAGRDRRPALCRAAAFPWRHPAARCPPAVVSSASSGSNNNAIIERFQFHGVSPVCLFQLIESCARMTDRSS